MKLTDAQIAHVRSLEDPDGRITPSRVVEDAQAETSPLHGLFEWDEHKAAMSHWIDTGREIIGAVRVVVTTETSMIKAPFYVRDPEATGQGYQSVTALRLDPDRARESIVQTLEVAAGHIRRAQELAAPLGLTSEIDDLLERITGVQRVAQTKAAA